MSKVRRRGDGWLETWLGKEENRKLHAEESFILDVTEKILEALEKQEINQNELASRLGTSKAFVSQLLNGGRNMTLRTLADICFALRLAPELALRRKEHTVSVRPPHSRKVVSLRLR
jgi:DNA-binding Xre family transcriptional regulator